MRTITVVGTSACIAIAMACGGTNGTDVFGNADVDGGGATGMDASGTTGMTGKDSGTGGGPTDGGGGGNKEGGGGGKDAGIAPLPDGGVTGVPGVVLWLDAAKGITPDMNVASKVAAWADQSGNGNNAAQNNTNFRPSLVSSAIHGKPALHFTATVNGLTNGTMLNIPDSATLEWSTGDYLIEIVTRYDNMTAGNAVTEGATGYGTLYSKQTFVASPVGVNFLANTPSMPSVAGTTAFSSFVDSSHGISSAATGYNDGTARLLAVQRTGGTTLTLRDNGAVSSTSSAIPSTDVDNVGVGARIGANGDANLARLDGDIAEVIAVKGTISSADLAGIEGYLMNKYGL